MIKTIFTIIRISVYLWATFEFLLTAFVYSIGLQRTKSSSKIISSLINSFSTISFAFIFIAIVTILRIMNKDSYLFFIRFAFIPVLVCAIYIRKFRKQSMKPDKVVKEVKKVVKKIKKL